MNIIEFISEKSGKTQLEKVKSAILFADERAFLDPHFSTCAISEELEKSEFWKELSAAYTAESEKTGAVDTLDIFAQICAKNFYRSQLKEREALILKMSLELKGLKDSANG